MHHLNFVVKRVHHTMLSFARPFAKFFNITPARYDVLKCLNLGGGDGGWFQAELASNLGVTRATMSRMLIALEKVGLIVRKHLTDERGRRHRRKKWVELSVEGRRIVNAVDQSIVYPWFQTAFEQFFMDKREIKRRAAENAVARIFTTLHDMTKHFFDTAFVRFYRPKPDLVFTRIRWTYLTRTRHYRPDETQHAYELNTRFRRWSTGNDDAYALVA